MKVLGICFGASTIKIIELNIDKKNNFKTGQKIITNHQKNPQGIFKELISKLDLGNYDYVTITGRRFKDNINISNITEIEAIEYGLQYLYNNKIIDKKYDGIASLGAENFIVYKLGNIGLIEKIETENKCASGTGDFFLQQIDRIGLDIDKAIKAVDYSYSYNIATRCSVYCKSDCTHALNTGVGKDEIVSGICKMMAEKVLKLFEKVNSKNVILIGGVTKNSAITDFMKNKMNDIYIPEDAEFFEALGAAYYAYSKKVKLKDNRIIKDSKRSFNFLPILNNADNLVEFKNIDYIKPQKNDECILGLDVGSTTTKAILLRFNDNAIISSVYLKTLGDPIRASRECYKKLSEKVNVDIKIIGIGITGSGRKITALHAGTEGIVNEIIAHSTGALYFDDGIDTIFEIGGQDAKYIQLINGVPVDYAMNEACAAGTGSFLEESIKNSFSITQEQIEDYALKSKKPLCFNDQCSAFINSDVKTAIQENNDQEDIIAGLVYSICMNYLNKVKSHRSIGNKIFMQGGVCYNRSVPIAMAKLLNKNIIVPPEPGLTGAFGVALEIKNKILNSQLKKGCYDLKELYKREISYGKTFLCNGNINCDRNCKINLLIIDKKKYPFGGACNKYDILQSKDNKAYISNYLAYRNKLLFTQEEENKNNNLKIGLNKSFLTYQLYPLFYNFFTKLGFNVVLSSGSGKINKKYKSISLCYPVEISHNNFYNLCVNEDIDYIFVPKIVELYVENSISYEREHQCTCLVLQSEAYLLQSEFNEIIDKSKFLTPELNFSQGYDTQINEFIKLANKLGKTTKEGILAYKYGLKKLNTFFSDIKNKGKAIINELEKNNKIGIVLFGKPYNALSDELNFGIPQKLSSLGYTVIPWDFLPFENEKCDGDMCWAIGQNILKAAAFVAKSPNLFGLYISNFACGPDSFLISYFRDIMKNKPSLTLEFDGHTANTGIDTRIEAFIDIINRYLKVKNQIREKKEDIIFQKAQIKLETNRPYFIDSDNKKISLFSNEVELLIPSMGEYVSEILASSFKSVGINAKALPVYDDEAFKLGRENTLGKECLPLILVLGGLLKYLKNNKDKNKKIAYFMPSNPGNCRFTQYSVFINKIIEKKQIRDVALLSLSPENSYAGIPINGMLTFLKGIIISDVMEDIKNTLKVIAADKKHALDLLSKEWQLIISHISSYGSKKLYKILNDVSKRLKKIPLSKTLKNSKVVSLLGDFFARRDDFCCRDIIKRLESKDIIVKREHVFSWFCYVDFLLESKIINTAFTFKERIEFIVKQFLQKHYDKKIKKIFSKSNLFEYEPMNIKEVNDYSRNYFDKRYTGEQVLVIGNYFKDILKKVHGVISVSPFACMPMNVVDSILSKESTLEKIIEIESKINKKKAGYYKKFEGLHHLPFLTIEVDGNPFPQIVESRIESFCLQVERVYNYNKNDH